MTRGLVGDTTKPDARADSLFASFHVKNNSALASTATARGAVTVNPGSQHIHVAADPVNGIVSDWLSRGRWLAPIMDRCGGMKRRRRLLGSRVVHGRFGGWRRG